MSAPAGPPPLEPFGLILHHDGRWSHEGQPLQNRKLREHFDRSVQYLQSERKYIVTLQHFRGEIELEEAGFFVRSFDSETGSLTLSDGTNETLVPASLALSPIDRGYLCRVKRELEPEGLLARFTHAAHAQLLDAVEEGEGGEPTLRIGSGTHSLAALDEG